MNLKRPQNFVFQIIGLVAISAALRFPFYASLIHSANSRGIDPLHYPYPSWCIWDCAHYTEMSNHYNVDSVIYFPGFPWTIMGLRALLPSLTDRAAALFLSNAFSILALTLIAIFFLMLEFGEKWKNSFGKPSKTWLTLALIAFFPGSHFWSNGYAESEQIASLALVYILVFQKKWLWASLIAGLTALVRIQCAEITVVFGGLLVIDFMQGRGWFGTRLENRLAGLKPWVSVLSCLFLSTPFLAFMAWQWVERGDPLLFLHKMQTGGRPHDLWEVVRLHFPRWDLNYVLLILSHVSAFSMIRRSGFHWKFLALTTWILALLPLAFGGFSWGYLRYMSCSLGLFISLGEFFYSRPWFAYPWLGWSVFRLGVEVDGWTKGQWRG